MTCETTNYNSLELAQSVNPSDEVILIVADSPLRTTVSDLLSGVQSSSQSQIDDIIDSLEQVEMSVATLNTTTVELFDVNNPVDLSGYDFVSTVGYETKGDGGAANYRRTTNSLDANGENIWWFEKNGAKFELAEDRPTLAMYGVVNSSDNHTNIIEQAYAHRVNKELYVTNVCDVNVDSYPSQIDNVILHADKNITFPNLQLPIWNGVISANESIAILAAVLRYYDAGAATDKLGRNTAGWYLINDKAGARHDPVLAGPVTASGSGSIKLKVNLNDFGLDETLWTPAGASFSPDETFCQDGVTFGGSVGTDDMTILGVYNSIRSSIQTYDFASNSFSGSNSPYTTNWVQGSTSAYLNVVRDSTKIRGAYASGSTHPMVCTFAGANDTYVHCSVDNISANGFRVYFWDNNGNQLGSNNGDPLPDNSGVIIHDPMMQPQPFNFGANPGTGRNIWITAIYINK